MKDKLLVLTAFAIMLVACSKDSESMNDPAPISKDNTSVNTQQPVQFGAYVNRAVTRAGAEGVLTTNGTGDGQVSLEQKGFGVFAYYTDDDLYSPIYQPNFMYNTKVAYQTDHWEYNPVRYWPNEFGADAASEGIDRLSFFAYAPWVEVTPSTGIVTGDNTYGIVGMSRNAATGDPLVKYYASLDPAKQVDFSWGVSKADGKPLTDMTKQAVNEKVEFAFNHALAALNVKIDAAIDELTTGSNTLGDETRIYVRSVTFEGFVTKGAFNLNTDKAKWYDLAGANYIDGGSITIYDGRTNGREGQSESVNETPTGLNDVIRQTVPYADAASLPAGVTHTAVNLFNSASADASIYVIPSGQPVQVTIVYDVETQNPKLATHLSDGETHGTSIENKITKTIKLTDGTAMKLDAGKKYTINLHLGMTSVKFDATVNVWPTESEIANTNLPDNFSSLSQVSLSETSQTVWIGESVTTPTVTVSDGVETITGANITWASNNTSVATVDESSGAITVVGAGVAMITVTAEKDGKSKTADFTLNVNAVTGISISPTTAEVTTGGTQTLTATLTHTYNGNIASWPTVTWSSDNTEHFTVDPAKATATHSTSTTATTTATAVAAGTATITATVGSDFVADNISGTANLTCTAATPGPSPAAGYFRGYDISKGILKKSNGVYSLSDEDNQLAIFNYYGHDEYLNVYYHTFSALRNDLGDDGNDGITSNPVVEDWVIPSQEDWDTIINGEATNITVNGTNVDYGFVMVQTASGNYGLIVIPDNTAIVCTNIDKGTVGDAYISFSDNILTANDMVSILNSGCVFIPCSGGYFRQYTNPVWQGGPGSIETDSYGWYWSRTYDDNDESFRLSVEFYDLLTDGTDDTNLKYYPVRLVKKMVP